MLDIKIPGHVHARQDAHGTVVMLNAVTGQWHALNATAATLWRSWADGKGFEESVAAIAVRHTTADAGRIRDDASRLLTDLADRGIVQVMPPTRATGPRIPEARTPTRPGPVLRVLAVFGVLGAIALVRLPFRMTCGAVRALRPLRRTPATWERATAIVDATHRAGAPFPGRVACLELSLAAVLVGAVCGRRLDWCLGAAPDPYRFHAWVEAEGRAVPDAAESGAGNFARILAL